ncbi:MAG: GerMN domain-containing protein [Coriobacteriia bacterium]|nr:GerMN domain-containing protein [Coriobacteriia bacterium]
MSLRRIVPGVACLIAVAVLLGGCGKNIPGPLSSQPGSLETTAVVIYYPSTTDAVIVREGKRLPLEGDLKLAALDELFKGKKIEPVTPLGAITDQVEVYSVDVDEAGLATIDFSKEILGLDAPEEYLRLLIAAMAQTLIQFDDVEAITFSVEGRTSGEVDGKRIEDWWGSVTLAEGPWR